MIDTLRGILGAVVCGDFLLAFILLALMALLKQRKARENAEIPSGTEAAPKTDEARRVRDAQEDAEAWRQLQNYGVRDAYGGDSG